LPTIWGKFGRKIDQAHERIESWPTPDGDSISVARVDPATPTAPTLVVLHGLEGTVRSTYAQGLLHQARARGWGAAMLIFRTCDGRLPDVPRLYHSGETSDVALVIRRLVKDRPTAPILCVGISLGANVLLKWLGEQGDQPPPEVWAAAAVSTPFDLEAGARQLERGLSRVYAWHFIRTLKRKGVAALERHPTLPVDRRRLETARTLRDFDDAFTAPVHGFDGASDYYERSSSLAFLPMIRVRTLLLSAVNDPFLPPVVLERVGDVARSNPALSLEFTRAGGHVGWVSGSPWRPSYYMESRVCTWLDSRLRDQAHVGTGIRAKTGLID
jgi:predicted alpha/beta-fold hydrolase